MIYFDNAATSWPKPPGVIEAMVHFMQEVGANPGRSGHRLSVEAGRIVYETREAVAELFNIEDPLRIAFGYNVTEALNLALRGYLRSGDHVITSSMEHNSVMRPLRALEREGVQLTVVACSPEGFLDPADVEAAIQPNTVMVVINHASNVVGSLLPVTEAGRICRQHDLLLLVDAAQTAGAYPIDVEADRIDLLGFTGHKALCGPMGTGGLYIGPRVDLERFEPLKRGGTGSLSKMEEQPNFLPDLCESGTANAVGLAGLGAGVRFVLEQGVEKIRRHEEALTAQLIEGLQAIPSTGSGQAPSTGSGQAPSTGPSAGSGQGSGRRPGVTLYGGCDAARQTATVSFNVAGLEPSEVGLRLDEEYGILCRVGLHCAPSAHKTIGTFPTGTVRFALCYFNTEEEIEAAVRAVREMAGW